jgi:hypothetical protein
MAPRDCGQTTPEVDLVAAVHVADRSYFLKINREFEKHDAVLYELVAPEGVNLAKGARRESGNPISGLQRIMKEILELEFQLDAVDYTRPNMVHADMSPQQLAKSMHDRGESVLTMFLNMMGAALTQQVKSGSNAGDLELLMALFEEHRALALKRALAAQFEQLEGTLTALGGPDGSSLIEQRNKVALGVLAKQLEAGKQRVAIFYGAGHMKDIQQRLQDDFDLVPVGTRWLVAWDLKDAPKKTAVSGKAAARPAK